ncbi:MAG: InlB B-repeat-containing protein, partial [Clostridiales bacterium]|nr:InlB B-repeat-containing protein [Clostridiales bacterium]
CGDIELTETVEVEITVKLNASATVMVGDYVKNTIVAKSDNDKDKEDEDDKPLILRNPDASITKVADVTELHRGEEFTYTLTLTNSDKATGAWRNVVVTDILPVGLDYLDGSSSQGTVAIGADKKTVTVTVGDIAIGATVTAEIKVKVNNLAVVGEVIVNTTIAKSDNEEDKEDTDMKYLIGPDGSITKQAYTTKVHVGDQYKYLITISNSNTATEPWKNVIATDDLPAELDYVSATELTTKGVSITEASGTVTISCGNIAIGETVTVEITVEVNDNAVVGDKIKNKVVATSDNDDDEEDEDEDPEIMPLYKVTYVANGGIGGPHEVTGIHGGTDHTVLGLPDIGISHPEHDFLGWNTEPDGSGDAYDPGDLITVDEDIILYAQWGVPDGSISKQADTTAVHVGDQYKYLITITNAATAFTAWKNVIATDDLPAELDYVSATELTTKGVTITEVSGTVTISCGDIAIGEIMIVEITVEVNDKAVVGDKIKNKVVATSDNDDEKYDEDDDPEIMPLYKVTYEANGGIGGPHLVIDIPAGTTHTVLDLTVTGISRPGYTFLGWNTAADGSGASFVPGTVLIVNSDIRLYAQWYFSGGGSKPVIEVSTVGLTPGGTVDVTYGIKNNTIGFSVLDLELPYNGKIYQPIKITPGSILDENSGIFLANPSFGGNDILKIIYIDYEKVIGDGLLFTVTYKAAPDAPPVDEKLDLEVIQARIALSDIDFADIDLQVEPGTMIIGIPGDVNGDGEITPEDAMTLLQMYVGLIPWTPRALFFGDINKDGIIDITDSALILRMVVGG